MYHITNMYQGGRVMDEKKLWEDCAAFHGHKCPGLMIGFKASLCAMELLHLDFSDDEEVVCVAENDACGIDAIQFVLGCSVGKGNLLFRMRGKQAFSFINRTTGESVRIVLKDKPKMSREESFAWYESHKPTELFDVKECNIEIPERARIFQSIKCENCGETTAEHMIRLQGGKKLCLDCYSEYRRFDV